MRQLKLFSNLFLIIAVAFAACKSKPKQVNSLSEGMPGEIMVVSNEDQLDQIQDIFKTYFQIKDSTLILSEKAESGQRENAFNYFFAREKSYEGTDKQASNIILWNTVAEYSTDLKSFTPFKTIKQGGYTIQCYKNVWAKPQIVVQVEIARNEPDAKTLTSIAENCTRFFSKEELLPGNLLPNKYCDSVLNRIKGAYGFGFQFTPNFRLEFSNQEVVWLRQESTKFYRDIFVNIFSDSIIIDSKEKAIENRNIFSKKYLKNDEHTLVTVSRSNLFPSKFETFGNDFVLKGWYQEEGTFRRGPFVRYFFHDKANKRYVAWDGFVYAPDMQRLQFYRTFEILAKTFSFDK